MFQNVRETYGAIKGLFRAPSLLPYNSTTDTTTGSVTNCSFGTAVWGFRDEGGLLWRWLRRRNE